MSYEVFEREILNLTGIDLTLYREKQMKRRLCTLVDRLAPGGFGDYLALLKKDRKSLEYFLDYITINVTEFFRTPEQWEYVADHVLAGLRDDAVIWSAGCSTGEEPYSLAMSIAARRPLSGISIIATDIDRRALETASRGEYPAGSFFSMDDAVRDRWFGRTENGYAVGDEIKSHVEFRQLNLLSDPFPEGCDLIVCRNVLIYFTEEAHDMLYRKFNCSLLPGGHLFTGRVEQILSCKSLGFEKETNFLYKKI